MSVTVRRATVADAAAISHVRVASWRIAYDGLIAPEILDRLDADVETSRRVAGWERRHADPRTADLVAERAGEVVGWAALGPSETAELPHHGQLFAIYALPDAWGSGVGHALISASETHLQRSGYRQALLWVLDGNERAAEFYERHGWHEDGATLVDDRMLPHSPAHALHERRRAKTLSTEIS
ncbi:MAG: hypothetical protein ABS63_06415 [Microbacterium sp. SCN 70-27]|uniref:GNAT family N-acetyltransferase n=1 Tax=unclassified Microbacterium TaxID=2609290 RepID=UPI00086BE5BB|nr:MULTISPECIES: GNAT family N-acetyltransferase [unclassified Microbacterium]MBN9224028.1 GNAT family N-acetyltransferase [Microbacterium sp.]ODT27926.1 MAG: hypothetical protein ABS63_06415 [Microbacterium sp. SCN 70-27]